VLPVPRYDPGYGLTLRLDGGPGLRVPSAHVLDPGQHIALSLPRAGKRHTIYWIPGTILHLGATASMIRQLAQHLSG
jgi:hypothetical protein